MNQSYRVRIKTKVIIRIVVFAFTIVTVLSTGLFYLFDYNLNVQSGYSSFGKHYFLKPIKTRRDNTRLQNTFTVGTFKLPSSKTIEHHINKTTSPDGFYCIAEVVKDSKIIKYQLVSRDKCV